MTEKAVYDMDNAAGRHRGCGREHGRGIEQGQGQGWGGRGGARVSRPFPMELSSQSDSSNTRDDANLTNSHPRTTMDINNSPAHPMKT